MNLEWRDPNTGQIKIWVWVVAGVAALVGIMLLMRTSPTTSAGVVSEGQSSDITDQLAQFQDALDQLAEQSQPTPNPNPAPTPTPNPIPTPSTTKSYTVKSGDTWNSIAANFGISLQKLYELNPTVAQVGRPDHKRIGGRIIQIPFNATPSTPTPVNREYTIKAGDTLKGIAKSFNLSLTELKALNPNLRGFKTPRVKRAGGKTISVGVGTANIKS